MEPKYLSSRAIYTANIATRTNEALTVF